MQATQLPTLLEIPEHLPLVPVLGKRPYEKDWVNKQYNHLEILRELEKGKATGFGLKLGNGLLAVDIDGPSAAKLLQKLAGENNLSDFAKTTAWTSGRPGRKQCLFSVPEAAWHRIKYQKILTGITGDDGKEECLEFRWVGHQSVLPPSIHPSTGKPYTWINNPLQSPPIQAPEWLIELCENRHSDATISDSQAQKSKHIATNRKPHSEVNDNGLDLVRFPARLFAHFGRQMSIWLLARRFDLSRHSHAGKSKGSGIGTFTLLAASRILDRSKHRVRRLLCEAKKSGLIRNFHQKGDWVKVYYTSFEKAVALTDLEKVGPIAAIDIDDLSWLHILATEIEAQYQQKLALYCKRQEEIEKLKAQGLDPDKIPSRIVQPGALHTCELPARVLARGSRFLYCEWEFLFYGGKQETIANNRKVSPGTVGRHLSNSYRMKSTPVRHQRSDVPPILKKQLLEKLPALEEMPARLLSQAGLIFLQDNWWEPHPNIYLLEHRLISARRRRSRIARKNR
ncbi:bifunctional DNA primase/polymerase [Microcoleus sp. herbarium5]|uniref:bifunctional DNA primase/polymerase n=1 Tax=Microcoleus sp. herbarium5 TaxID=3055434 RepID=UPI002FCFB57A